MKPAGIINLQDRVRKRCPDSSRQYTAPAGQISIFVIPGITLSLLLL